MTRFNSFYNHLELKQLYLFCQQNGKKHTYRKGQYFVHEGEECKYLGLIQSGYFKYTTLSSTGNEVVVGFAIEGEFVTMFNNAMSEIPSETSIIAGSNADIIEIPISTFKKFISESAPHYHTAISDALFRTLYRRLLDIYRLSPKERYMQLLKHNRNIIHYVPLQEIASYLLITPQYLSSIRRSLSQQEQAGI